MTDVVNYRYGIIEIVSNAYMEYKVITMDYIDILLDSSLDIYSSTVRQFIVSFEFILPHSLSVSRFMFSPF